MKNFSYEKVRRIITIIDLQDKTSFPNCLQRIKGRIKGYREKLRSFYGLLSLPLIRQARWIFLRRIQPLPSYAGVYRGVQIPRYFFDRWIYSHADSIRGHVAEIGSPQYVKRVGGSKVTRIEVVDIDPENPQATIVADLSQANSIPDNSFDCFVVPFTFHIIYDIKSALYHSIRVLKPGGILLANFAGYGYLPAEAPPDRWKRYWHFTAPYVRTVLEELVPPDRIEMDVYGNVFSVFAFCMGFSVAELTEKEINFKDERFPLLICVKVVKPQGKEKRNVY
jgi:SAM-dependent methyltransferase